MITININNLSITLMRDYKKEFFNIPQSCYLNFSPIAEPNVYTYKTILLNKKDPLCYIKHKTKDLWVYEENDGKLVFKQIHVNNRSLCTDVTNKCSTMMEQPKVFWIEYVEEPVFVLYKTFGPGVEKVAYLEYVEINNSIYMHWVYDFTYATKFSFTEFNLDWSVYITKNEQAKPDL